MNKILVIGASGLVGSEFVRLASKKADMVGVDEKTVDITDKASIKTYFSKNRFDAVVNFAAITDVDGAEAQRGDEDGFVWKLNVEGVRNLAEVCKKNKTFLTQISTDFVFTGDEKTPGPYSEDSVVPDSMEGIGWYGWTKNRAEKTLRESGCGYAVVRIAYPFYAHSYEGKLDFAKNYLKLFDEGKLFPIFTDQTLNPLLVDELVDPLLKILETKKNGVYHIVSSNTTTPFEFVSYLLKKARNVEKAVQQGSMEQFLKAEGRTPRPRLGGLMARETQKQLGLKFKTWQEMIEEFVEKLS